MTDENVVNAGDRFVERRVREKPVVYTVQITHLVIDGIWNMGLNVMDVGPLDAENRERIAADLEQAAAMLRDPNNQWKETP